MNGMRRFCRWLIILGPGALGSAVQAHTFGGRLSSVPDSAASYSVNCYNDGNGEAAQLFFNIQGKTANAPYNLTLAVQKKLDNGQVISAGPVVDPINGDAGSSPSAALRGGSGSYVLTVGKSPRQPGGSTAGASVFSFDFHCETASGAHTGTDQPIAISVPVDPPDPIDPVDPVIPTQPKAKVTSFSGSLGKFATERRYAVACAPQGNQTTVRYWFSIRGATKNRPFRVQLTGAKGEVTRVVNDPSNDDKAFGPWAYIEGGDGPYILSIGKLPSDGGSTLGNMAFKVNHTCEAESGLRTRISAAKAIR